MSNCDEIKKRNIYINKLLKNLVEQMKRNKVKTFNEDGTMNENIKKILELELKKCISIYCFEYGFEIPTERISVHEAKTRDGQINRKPELNARGGEDGVTVYAGLQNALDSILSSTNVGLTSQVFEDNKIHATRVFGKDVAPTKLSGNTYVSSHRDQLDYFAELLKTGKIDLDFILDVFPHEAMHVFIPGQGVFVEGTTERLAREASDKYGLRLSPTSHSKETAIIARLEAILGREAISSIALTNKQKEMRKVDKNSIDILRFDELSKAIDDKMGAGTFDRLKEILDKEYKEFLNYRTTPDEFQTYRTTSFSETINSLDEWIKNNPDKLQLPNNSNDLTEEQKAEIDEIQNDQINLIQTLLEKLKQKGINKDTDMR